MGSRGPIRLATSTRGARQARLERKAPVPIVEKEIPDRPDWIPPAAIPIWEATIADLQRTDVPLERIDGSAIAFYVLCIHGAREALAADDSRMLARMGRDALQWANAIGATQAARSRMGIKPKLVQVEQNKFATL